MSGDARGVLVLGARNLGGAMAREFLAAGWHQDAIARAAVFLAEQPSGALTHELQVTPAGDRWVP